MKNKAVEILLVEDDEVDVRALKRTFQELKIANTIHVARDGFEAFDILRGTDDRSPLPRPYIILLDLNMPRMNGIEFLKEVRNDPKLHDSVVFVLTTSRAEEDKIEAYRLNVAGYMVKSRLGTSFFECVTMLDHFWRVIEFP